MSNVLFPSLPGLSWGSTREPIWKTKAASSASGMEQRAGYMSYPLYRLKLSYEFLRAGAEAELQTLVGFFNQRGGDLDSFLLLDPSDSVATDQQFGTGDGSTTVFRLGRTLGGAYEPVSATSGTPTIKVDGITQTVTTDYTLDANTALVTFTTAPAADAVLTWSGTHLRRVRFERSSLEFKEFLQDLWEAKTLSLMTVKT